MFPAMDELAAAARHPYPGVPAAYAPSAPVPVPGAAAAYASPAGDSASAPRSGRSLQSMILAATHASAGPVKPKSLTADFNLAAAPAPSVNAAGPVSTPLHVPGKVADVLPSPPQTPPVNMKASEISPRRKAEPARRGPAGSHKYAGPAYAASPAPECLPAPVFALDDDDDDFATAGMEPVAAPSWAGVAASPAPAPLQPVLTGAPDPVKQLAASLKPPAVSVKKQKAKKAGKASNNNSNNNTNSNSNNNDKPGKGKGKNKKSKNKKKAAAEPAQPVQILRRAQSMPQTPEPNAAAATADLKRMLNLKPQQSAGVLSELQKVAPGRVRVSTVSAPGAQEAQQLQRLQSHASTTSVVSTQSALLDASADLRKMLNIGN